MAAVLNMVNELNQRISMELSVRNRHLPPCSQEMPGRDCNPLPQPEAPKYQHIFSAYPSFNILQSKVLNDILHSDNPVVIAAPTGSGKTVIFELALVRLLMKFENLYKTGNFIIVYLAPIKALCTERFLDWQNKFSSLGLVCREVTGDTDVTELSQLSKCNILLTTPEKWDSLTRNWRDNQTFVQLVKLFFIDEVHLVSEQKRGPIMEAVVSRMKTVQETLEFTSCHDSDVPLRFVAVSATIPNIEDVAKWLGTKNNPAISFSLGEDYRPVKLTKIVLGYDCPKGFSQFRFEIQLSYKLRSLLFKYSEQKPTLVFCSTRKGVLQTTEVLSKQITFHFSEEHKEKLRKFAAAMKENKLKDYILSGVGCHHAGMDISDRHIVENLFRNAYLPVLVTTTTLAMGVNLPAHLVIIKSTQQYAGGCYQDYSENQLLQMIGRAGRPQYDTTATAIIMTKHSKVSHYKKIAENKDILESSLHKHLAEHLNAEVVLCTIKEKAVAINWIRSTFLYVRALENPKYYGISPELSKKGIEDKLQEMCLIELNALASCNMVKMDVFDVYPTQIGRLMASYYMAFETMKKFSTVDGTENLPKILAVLAGCNEFTDYQLRTNEKRILNSMNQLKNGIRFPLSSTVKTREMKINCLVQASLGQLTIQDPSLHQESIRIIRVGQRVSSCLVKYLSLQSHYSSLLNATILAKCFHCNMWENSSYVSRQLERIGPVLSSCLVTSGKTTFKALLESNPRDLERILNRPPPMGDNIQYAVRYLPQYDLQLERVRDKIYINLILINKSDIEKKNTAGPQHWLVLLVGDDTNKLLLRKRFTDAFLLENGGHYCLTLTVTDLSGIETISANLISEQWVGLDVQSSLQVSVKNTVPPKVQATLRKYVEDSINPKEKTPHKQKQNKASLLSQWQDISKEFLQNMGSKRLRTSLELTKGQMSLDAYLFKPVRDDKLPPIKKSRKTQSETQQTVNKCEQPLTKLDANEVVEVICNQVQETEKETTKAPVTKDTKENSDTNTDSESSTYSRHLSCTSTDSNTKYPFHEKKRRKLEAKYYPLFFKPPSTEEKSHENSEVTQNKRTGENLEDKNTQTDIENLSVTFIHNSQINKYDEEAGLKNCAEINFDLGVDSFMHDFFAGTLISPCKDQGLDRNILTSNEKSPPGEIIDLKNDHNTKNSKGDGTLGGMELTSNIVPTNHFTNVTPNGPLSKPTIYLSKTQEYAAKILSMKSYDQMNELPLHFEYEYNNLLSRTEVTTVASSCNNRNSLIKPLQSKVSSAEKLSNMYPESLCKQNKPSYPDNSMRNTSPQTQPLQKQMICTSEIPSPEKLTDRNLEDMYNQIMKPLLHPDDTIRNKSKCLNPLLKQVPCPSESEKFTNRYVKNLCIPNTSIINKPPLTRPFQNETIYEAPSPEKYIEKYPRDFCNQVKMTISVPDNTRNSSQSIKPWQKQVNYTLEELPPEKYANRYSKDLENLCMRRKSPWGEDYAERYWNPIKEYQTNNNDQFPESFCSNLYQKALHRRNITKLGEAFGSQVVRRSPIQNNSFHVNHNCQSDPCMLCDAGDALNNNSAYNKDEITQYKTGGVNESVASTETFEFDSSSYRYEMSESLMNNMFQNTSSLVTAANDNFMTNPQLVAKEDSFNQFSDTDKIDYNPFKWMLNPTEYLAKSDDKKDNNEDQEQFSRSMFLLFQMCDNGTNVRLK